MKSLLNYFLVEITELQIDVHVHVSVNNNY